MVCASSDPARGRAHGIPQYVPQTESECKGIRDRGEAAHVNAGGLAGGDEDGRASTRRNAPPGSNQRAALATSAANTSLPGSSQPRCTGTLRKNSVGSGSGGRRVRPDAARLRQNDIGCASVAPGDIAEWGPWGVQCLFRCVRARAPATPTPFLCDSHANGSILRVGS